jgi:hypothetical protein
MVPSQLSSRLGFINPGLTLNGVQNGVSMVFQCHVENPEKLGCKMLQKNLGRLRKKYGGFSPNCIC